MNRVRRTLALAVTLALLAPGCGKDSSSRSTGSDPMKAGDMTAAGDMDPVDPMGGPVVPDGGSAGMAPDMAAPDPMGSAPKVTDGPTGILECDQALELVCKCKEKDKAFSYACDQMKVDAAAKKAKLPTLEPDQVEDEKKACQRALEQVKALPQCQ